MNRLTKLSAVGVGSTVDAVRRNVLNNVGEGISSGRRGAAVRFNALLPSHRRAMASSHSMPQCRHVCHKTKLRSLPCADAVTASVEAKRDCIVLRRVTVRSCCAA